MHDVVLVAHYFGVSRLAALYRLKNLGFLSPKELETLKEQEEDGQGRKLAALLGLPDLEEEAARNDFRHRFLALALEALRREEITRSKLGELAGMVAVSAAELDDVLARGHDLAPSSRE